MPDPAIFSQAVLQSGLAVTLADMSRPDHPLVFVNRAFELLSGYDAGEIVGRNCRFLQGAATDPQAVQQLRDAVQREEPCLVELINYTRQGESFINALHLGPIFDNDGKLTYYFGSQWDITEKRDLASALEHQRERSDRLSQRLRDIFSLVNAVVGLSTAGDARPLGLTIEQRIMALSRACELTEPDAADTPVPLMALLDAALDAHVARDDERLIRVGPPLSIAQRQTALLGIAMDALASAAERHGALARPDGRVMLNWQIVRPAGRQVLSMSWRETLASAMDERALALEECDAHALLGRLFNAMDGHLRTELAGRELSVEMQMPLPHDALAAH